MDTQSYNNALTDLRAVRDRIKKAGAEPAELEASRDQRTTGPLTAPAAEEELLTLRDTGRAALTFAGQET